VNCFPTNASEISLANDVSSSSNNPCVRSESVLKASPIRRCKVFVTGMCFTRIGPSPNRSTFDSDFDYYFTAREPCPVQ
jgi:hypothetical protein